MKGGSYLEVFPLHNILKVELLLFQGINPSMVIAEDTFDRLCCGGSDCGGGGGEMALVTWKGNVESVSFIKKKSVLN